MPTDSLTLLRDAISARLSDDTSFSSTPTVAILDEETGDAAAAITQALSTDGLVGVVRTPTLAPGPDGRQLLARARVELYEDTLVNRQGTGYKTAPELILCALNLLRDWAPDDGAWKELVLVAHQFEPGANTLRHTLDLTSELLT